jgi:hypothetical protein
MKMTRNDKERDRPLDDILADARAHLAPLPPDLLRRVLEDAARVQPIAKPVAVRRRNIFSLKWPDFQALSVVGGMVTACCVGFWLGISPPSALEDVVIPGNGFWEPADLGDTVEVSGFGWDTGEV